MAIGKVVAFWPDRASGEVEIENGACYSFTVEKLATYGLPTVGARAEVVLGPTRRGEGVISLSILPQVDQIEEACVFLDCSLGEIVLWRVDSGELLTFKGTSAEEPGTLVTLTLEQETGSQVHGEPRPQVPAAIRRRQGDVPPATAAKIAERAARAWRAYGDSIWNHPRGTAAFRATARAAAAWGGPLPQAPIARRLTRALAPSTIESRLGAPLGPLARALFDEAKTIRPSEPSCAFEDLGVLFWILHEANDTTAADIFGDCPVPCIPFASLYGTEVSLASIDAGDGRDFDKMPVIAFDERNCTSVVAVDFAAFIGQVKAGEWKRRRAWKAVTKGALPDTLLEDARAALIAAARSV